MTLSEMIPANDPRMKNTFDYNKKENRFYLMPLKLEFNKKDYGFFGAIPKKTCNLVRADEITRRLSGVLEVNNSETDAEAVKKELEEAISGGNSTAK
jgi:hypothetical protein